MKNYSRNLIFSATLLVAASGAAYADRVDPGPPAQQTNWFLRLFMPSAPAVAPKPQPATNKLAERTVAVPASRPGSGSLVAKPQPSCTYLTCVILVGIGF